MIDNAGLELWDDLFQTLRRSCETQMAMTVPQHAVSAWIGHSELESVRHYLQVTDELFDRVTGVDVLGCKHKSAAERAAVKPGIESQDGEIESGDTRTDSGGESRNPNNCGVILDTAADCEVVRGGIEPPTHGFSVPMAESAKSSLSPAIAETYDFCELTEIHRAQQKAQQFSTSSICDLSELALIVEAWPSLPPQVRTALVTLVKSMSSQQLEPVHEMTKVMAANR